MIIYKAVHKATGRIYIGQTTKTLEERISKHLTQDSLFPRALRKYGRDAFDISVIDRSESRDELNRKEIYWIAHCGCMHPNGYNLTAGGEGGLGYVFTEEALAKVRAAKITNPMSQAGRERVRQAMTGRTVSEETRKKVSAANKGRKREFSEEHRRNLGNAQRGKKRKGVIHSEETREYLRQINLGRIITVEAREKLRQHNLGKKASEETRQKMREAHQRRNAAKRAERLAQENLSLF
jgi:group I intron endonuclease